MDASRSKKPLSGQFDLSRRLPGLEPAFGDADSTPFTELNLFFNIGMRTWAVVRDGDASEGPGT